MTLTAELKDQAIRVAGRVDPELMTGEQAARAVEDLAVAENAMAGAMLFLALRVARTDAWQGRGFKTAADWLASVCGISVNEAARHLGTAQKAEDLPKTKDAMKKGKISPDQADPVADAATADPTAEDDLLDIAERETNKNLKDEAAKRKSAVTDTETRDRRIHRDRSKRSWIDRDGAWNLHLRGTAADGARFDEQIRPFEEQAFRTGRSDGIRGTFENRGYDAVMALLGIRSFGGPEVEPAGPASPPATVPGGANTKVIVRIDHTALVRGRNLDPLCAGAGSCHHRKTHEGHEREEGSGRRRLLPPDHPDHPKNGARRGDTGPPETVDQPTLC